MQESPVSKARILSSLCLLTLALYPYQALWAQEAVGAGTDTGTVTSTDTSGESLDKVDAPPEQLPINDGTGPATGLSRDAAGAYTGTTPPDPSGLVPTKRKEDYEVINTQAESFRQRFLQGEAIELRLPLGGELMPLSATLPPIRLEASYTQPVSLKEAVLYCLDNNLDIRIQREAMTQNKWLSVGAFGKFLPDALMQYRSLYQAGTS